MTLASHLPRCATQPRVVLDVMVQPEVRRYFICFPEGRALDKVITENYRRTSLNGVVGAIDGSHIPIKGQFWRRDVATNRKLSYSMVLQAVAGPDLQLYDVDVGVWGSCHDARVFSTSELGDRILGDLPLPFPQDCFLLGDGAYPLLPYLLKNYDDSPLGVREIEFNKSLESGRVAVERAFGRLKMMWRILRHQFATIELTSKVSIASCVLHNVSIWERDLDVQMQYENEDYLSYNAAEGEYGHQPNGGTTTQGRQRRDQVANALFDF
eukprot:gb/GECG01010902.1/.p1 GENE.gb/GECG01010902.1/~~gb/GECG01010902.1/.p1  ORF type:complete len:268 (+),score=12.81 gb/GECG01010902.1/:1-804(+)